ncbi:MAG: hypothetical protein Q9M14_08935 [Mariprofundaceae bacterium]|nr:hypothetical protein [Mariprofundaceae bacterium]
MIIAPTITPAAQLNQTFVNQSQQQQVTSAESSRKASVTVQFSPEARELAGTENKESTQQKRQEAFQKTANKAPVTVQISSAGKELSASNNKVTQSAQQLEAQISKQINETNVLNQQQAINPSSKQPETNKLLNVA